MEDHQRTEVEVGFAGSWFALGIRAVHDRVLTNLIPSDWISRLAKRRLVLQQPENAVEVYVLAVTAALAVFWLVLPTNNVILRDTAVAVAAIRWYEIFVVALGLVAGSAFVVAGKSIFMAGLYGIQMVLIFATLGEATVTSPQDWHSAAPMTHLDWAYVSFTNMFTLGNAFQPTSTGSKLLVMGSLASGVLVLSIFVAYAMTQYGRNG